MTIPITIYEWKHVWLQMTLESRAMISPHCAWPTFQSPILLLASASSCSRSGWTYAKDKSLLKSRRIRTITIANILGALITFCVVLTIYVYMHSFNSPFYEAHIFTAFQGF